MKAMTYFDARLQIAGSRNFLMPADLPQTTSKICPLLVKQFSIFLPNKVGAMLDVVKLLQTHNTHVVALSISKSTDSAIARIMVSDPERVEELFREHNDSCDGRVRRFRDAERH